MNKITEKQKDSSTESSHSGISRHLENDLEVMRDKAKTYMWNYEYLKSVLKKYQYMAIWMLVLIVMSLLIGSLLSVYKLSAALGSKRTCKDFISQNDAQRSYEQGNKNLDGNKDGIACNSLSR